MFRVGQKVVCIRDDWYNRLIISVPTKDCVYTVRGLRPTSDIPDLYLREIINPKRQWADGFAEPSFIASYFRPVVDRKTDISIFTEMLTRTNRPVVERNGIAEIVAATLRPTRNPKGTSNAV